MRTTKLQGLLIAAVMLAGRAGAAADCAIEISGGMKKSDCNYLIKKSSGDTMCGCWVVEEISTDPPPCMPNADEPFVMGVACGGKASFGGTLKKGVDNLSVNWAGQQLHIGGPPQKIGGVGALDTLAGAMEQLGKVGRSVTDVTSFADPLPGGDRVVAAGEIVFDQGAATYTSLVVHGIYVAGGKVVVNGDVTVDGAAIFPLGLDAQKVDVKSTGPASGALFGQVKAKSLNVDHGFLRSTPLWTDGGGGIEISDSAKIVGGHVDAGVGLVVGNGEGSLSISEQSQVYAAEVRANPISVTGSKIGKMQSLVAHTLTATASQLSGSAGLSLVVDAAATMTTTDVFASRITATLGDANVASGTWSALPAAQSQLVLTTNVQDVDYFSQVIEECTGASYGGFGGTEGLLTGNVFRPSSGGLKGSPLDPHGDGFDGPGETAPGGSSGGGAGHELMLDAKALVWSGKATATGGGASTALHLGGGGGGTGGTIRFVVAGKLSGTGTLHANGGAGSQAQDSNQSFVTGGGGSGGRIYVRAGVFDASLPRAEAIGGLGGRYGETVENATPPWTDWRNHGGPGTVFWKEGDKPGRLVIDGAGVDPAGLGCGANGAPVCRGVGTLSGDFSTVDVVLRGATVTTTGLTARSLVLVNAHLVADDPRVRLHWPLPDRDYAGVDFTVNQTFYPSGVWADPLEEKIKIETVNDLAVDPGSTISLTSQGGYSRTALIGSDYYNWAGGSHGGIGGAGKHVDGQEPPETTPTYGSIEQPVTVGEGGLADVGFTGVQQAQCGLGGAGGGALRLVIGGVATIDGALASEGADGRRGVAGVYCISLQGTNGGAGGSVWLTATRLEGAGQLTTRGGRGAFEDGGGPNASRFGGGGGGGRIAVYAGLSGWKGAFHAEGGDGAVGYGEKPEARRGGDGTIYLNGTTLPTGSSAPPAPAPPAADEGGGGCATGRAAGVTGEVAGVSALLGLLGVIVRRRRRWANARGSSTPSSTALRPSTRRR